MKVQRAMNSTVGIVLQTALWRSSCQNCIDFRVMDSWCCEDLLTDLIGVYKQLSQEDTQERAADCPKDVESIQDSKDRDLGWQTDVSHTAFS